MGAVRNKPGKGRQPTGIEKNVTRNLSGGDPVQIAMVKELEAGTVNLGLTLMQSTLLPLLGLVG